VPAIPEGVENTPVTIEARRACRQWRSINTAEPVPFEDVTDTQDVTGRVA
jgi:hypothetical protein